MENKNNKSSRRSWTTEETKAFLDAYSKRQFEFQNTKLKKYAMANVLEDLLALGVLSQPTTVEMFQIKLKNLLRAFKATSDASKRTGESACKDPFEEQMEEIFGTRPEIRNIHTINLAGKPIKDLPMSDTTKDIDLLESENSSSAVLGSESPSASNPSAQSSSGKKKMSYREKNSNKKLELKRKTDEERNSILAEYVAKKIKKMEEAEEGKESRFLRKEALFRELFKK